MVGKTDASGKSANRIAATLRPYAIALAAQALLVITAYLIRNTFGIKIAVVSAIVEVLYFILLLGAAWLGYGPGLLVWTLTIVVVPRILGTARPGRPTDPVVIGLVLLVSVLISRIAQTRRRKEAELTRAAEVLEHRVQERTA